jgi:flagellar hook-length control protein FliK
MQALDEMLNRAPAVKADAGAVPADDKASPETPGAPAQAVPTLAMLMPTLIPAVMPPAPAARDASAQATAAEIPDTAAAQSPPSSIPALTGALTADPARVLALQAADAVPAAVDAPAWQGLQRWSADLMSAMTPAVNAAPQGDAGAAAPALTLPASREAWSQPLMQALGDRLQLQIAQRTDSARLHLEPPQLGRIEIDIRQQGGALQVQLSASHDEVRQQLRQIAEPLRNELVQRHAGEVSVQVATATQAAGDGRGRDGAASGGQAHSHGQPRDAQRQPGRALGDEDGAAPGGFAFADAFEAQTGTLTRNTR